MGADLGAVDRAGVTAAVIGFYSLANYLLGEGDDADASGEDRRAMDTVVKLVERMGVADMEKV